MRTAIPLVIVVALLYSYTSAQTRQADQRLFGPPYQSSLFMNTHFGAQAKLAKNEDILVVAEMNRGYQNVNGSGCIHIYIPMTDAFGAQNWTRTQTLYNNQYSNALVQALDFFGQSVSISDDGNVIVVGVPQYPYLVPGWATWDDISTGANGLPGKNNRGAAFVYTRVPGVNPPQYQFAQLLQLQNPETTSSRGMCPGVSCPSYPNDACHTQTPAKTLCRVMYREHFGNQVSMSADGNILFIGACSESPVQSYMSGKYKVNVNDGATTGGTMSGPFTVSPNQGVHVYVRSAASTWTFLQTVNTNETSAFGPECQSFAVSSDGAQLLMRGRPDLYTNNIKYFKISAPWSYPSASTSWTSSITPTISGTASSSSTLYQTQVGTASMSRAAVPSSTPSKTATPNWNVADPILPIAPYPTFPALPTWVQTTLGMGISDPLVSQYHFGRSMYFGDNGLAYFNTPRIDDKLYQCAISDTTATYKNTITAGLDVLYQYGSTSVFGHSMEQYKTLMVVGAPLDVAGSAAGKGAVFVYRLGADNTTWTKIDQLQGPSLSSYQIQLKVDISVGISDYFGIDTSMNYNWIVVGSPMTSQVHIFQNTYWLAPATPTPSPPVPQVVTIVNPPVTPPGQSQDLMLGLIIGLILLCCLLLLLFLLARWLIKRHLRKQAEERKKRQAAMAADGPPTPAESAVKDEAFL